MSKQLKMTIGLMFAKSVVDKVRIALTSEFGNNNWNSSYQLINRESGFNPYAINKSSGACGLGQSLPCSKVLAACGSLDDVVCQAKWIASYIKDRYGDPDTAWDFWQTPHEVDGKLVHYY